MLIPYVIALSCAFSHALFTTGTRGKTTTDCRSRCCASSNNSVDNCMLKTVLQLADFFIKIDYFLFKIDRPLTQDVRACGHNSVLIMQEAA